MLLHSGKWLIWKFLPIFTGCITCKHTGVKSTERKLMHTTTSWSSPPPAWRVWEVWGQKHSAWSSTRRHGARRAADTCSPVPASYRRRSEGGEKHRNRCTSVRLEVRPARRRHTSRSVKCSRKTQGKNFFFFKKRLCSAVAQALRWFCVWRLALADLAAGLRAKRPSDSV